MTKEIKKKNAGVAAILSAIVPGLGSVYCGHIVDGIVCFVMVNIFFGLYMGVSMASPGYSSSSAIGFFALVSMIAWGANIAGAYDTAKKINAGEITE